MSPDWNGEGGVKYVAQGEIRAHASQCALDHTCTQTNEWRRKGR